MSHYLLCPFTTWMYNCCVHRFVHDLMFFCVHIFSNNSNNLSVDISAFQYVLNYFVRPSVCLFRLISETAGPVSMEPSLAAMLRTLDSHRIVLHERFHHESPELPRGRSDLLLLGVMLGQPAPDLRRRFIHTHQSQLASSLDQLVGLHH